jgi:hypothetical protein
VSGGRGGGGGRGGEGGQAESRQLLQGQLLNRVRNPERVSKLAFLTASKKPLVHDWLLHAVLQLTKCCEDGKCQEVYKKCHVIMTQKKNTKVSECSQA